MLNKELKQAIGRAVDEMDLPDGVSKEARTTQLKKLSAQMGQIDLEPVSYTHLDVYKRQLKDPRRPGGSFIFAGPTGVGKTELAKTLAEFLFGDEDALIQLDMSEYSEKHTVSRLFGSPPGYVGYEEGGQLLSLIHI